MRPELKDYRVINLNTYVLEGWKNNHRQFTDVIKTDLTQVATLLAQGKRLSRKRKLD